MGRRMFYISKDDLIQLYEIDGFGCLKISKKLNCSKQTIRNLLKSYDIQMRNGNSLLDLTGKRYGLLFVLKRVGSDRSGYAKWLCRCDCGNEKAIFGGNLRSGNTKSCGCVKSKSTGRPNSQVVINCVMCGKERFMIKSRIGKYPICGSKACRLKLRSRLSKLNCGENNPNWLDGMVRYDTAIKYFEGIEELRRSPSDSRILEVRCLYCNRWFQPTKAQVNNRKIGIDRVGGNRFYCSDGCKESCPIYNKVKYPKGFRKETSREVDSDLRKIVLERDDWQCQKCGYINNLHVHHIEGYAQNLMLANDIDNCITLCKTCHKWVHTLEGCNYFELRCGPSHITGTSHNLL
jgi:5-methylcytosine-specific restriction endonuclease McrA